MGPSVRVKDVHVVDISLLTILVASLPMWAEQATVILMSQRYRLL